MHVTCRRAGTTVSNIRDLIEGLDLDLIEGLGHKGGPGFRDDEEDLAGAGGAAGPVAALHG